MHSGVWCFAGRGSRLNVMSWLTLTLPRLRGFGALRQLISDSLKNVLYAMDQRYYYADIYDENRVASSVRIVNN